MSVSFLHSDRGAPGLQALTVLRVAILGDVIINASTSPTIPMLEKNVIAEEVYVLAMDSHLPNYILCSEFIATVLYRAFPSPSEPQETVFPSFLLSHIVTREYV